MFISNFSMQMELRI